MATKPELQWLQNDTKWQASRKEKINDLLLTTTKSKQEKRYFLRFYSFVFVDVVWLLSFTPFENDGIQFWFNKQTSTLTNRHTYIHVPIHKQCTLTFNCLIYQFPTMELLYLPARFRSSNVNFFPEEILSLRNDETTKKKHRAFQEKGNF